jgi:hypothetical protein
MIGGTGLYFYVINQIDKKFGIRHKLDYYRFIHILFGFILSASNVSLIKSIITGYIVGCVLSNLPNIRKHMPPYYKFTDEERDERDGCLAYVMVGWLAGELIKIIFLSTSNLDSGKKKSESIVDYITIDDIMIE